MLSQPGLASSVEEHWLLKIVNNRPVFDAAECRDFFIQKHFSFCQQNISLSSVGLQENVFFICEFSPVVRKINWALDCMSTHVLILF